MDLSAILGGFQIAFSPLHILMIAFGALLGVFVGAVPGLNGPMAIVLLTPFTLAMPFSAGFLMAVGIYCGQLFGGSITAILFKAPGTAVAAATVIDGYEAARKGRAAEALSTAIFSSVIGGLFGLVILILLAPVLAEVALGFGPPEYFAFAFFGLIVIATLLSDSPIKGVIMMFLGLFLTTVGVDPMSGIARFTFGFERFLLGFHMIPVLIGLYPMAEAITRLVNPAEEQHLDSSSYHVSISLRKASRLIRSLWKNILRGSIIGTLIGIIPGAGGSTATFMAYADARRSSKNKDQFGKGCLEGIAAPEAANNASSGGAMVPLLTLGIPGSLTTAVMMGLFVAHGLQPGPLFFISNPDVVYSVYIALFVSNLLLIPAGVYGANLFARFLRIPSSLIYPIIFGISITGAFTLRNSFVDIWAAVLFAMLGFFLNAFRWPIAPLVIGMVLGPLIETSFRGSMVIFNGDAWRFFTRPISAVFLGVAFLFLLWSLLRFVIHRMRGPGQLEKK